MFDICVICFAELKHDARTLNIASAYAQAGKSVCVAGFGDENEAANYTDFTARIFKRSRSGHIYIDLLYFLKDLHFRREDLKAKIWWAADLYTLLAARLFAWRFGGEIIYDSREIYSALGPLHNQKFKQSIVTALEKILASKVSQFVVSGKLDADYLQKHLHSEKPFHVVLNVPKYKPPVKSDKLRERFNISPDKKIVLYQGAIMDGRGLKLLMDAIAFSDEFVLCVMGTGSDDDKYKKLAEQANLKGKVFFTGGIPYSELHEWTCSADIGSAFIEPVSFSYELALPNKMFEYFMAGVPVLASDLPAMKDIIDETGAGITVSSKADSSEILSKLREIAFGGKYDFYVKKCLEAGTKYCYEKQISVIHNIISR